MDVRLPDGTVISNVPDGISKAELVQRLARNGYDTSKLAPKEPAYNPTDDMGTFDRLAAGLGKSMVDTGRGIGQLFGMVSQEDVDAAAQRDKALMDTGAGMTGNIAGQVGQMIVPGALAAKGLKAANAARLMAGGAKGAIGRAALGSAAFAGTQPVLSGESRSGNMLAAGLAGGAGQGVVSGVGALARPAAAAMAPGVANLAARAESLGIPVNAAQLSDSKFVKTLASTLERLPFTGAGQSRAVQQEAFNRAVSRTFGENAPNVTQDVYAAAKQRIGGEFDRLTANNTLKLGDALLARLASVQDEAARFGTDDSARAVGNAIDELLSKADDAGNVPGRAYQALDSRLGKLAKSGDEKAMYLSRLRDEVRVAMDDSIGEADKQAWKTARSQYKNLKTVRDLVAKEGADGNISPALLAGRMNASQAGKESMAMGGGGELGDLARIGQQFLKDRIPDSGTAGRLTALGALGGGGYALGIDPQTTLLTLAGGATGGRALNKLLNSQAGRNYMLNGSGAAANLQRMLFPLPYAAGPLALDAGR